MLKRKDTVAELANAGEFIHRHIGPSPDEQKKMLSYLGYDSLDALIDDVVPQTIRTKGPLGLAAEMTEVDALDELQQLARKNSVFRSFIGQGYYNTHTPHVILRNVLENPAWYTAYTPYQPEISQGRLEALLNYQTMVTDLSGMEIANASMLDEATAAAEAMTLCQRMSRAKSRTFIVDADCFPQTIDIVRTRAEPLGIEVIVGDPAELLEQNGCFGVLLQYPGASGEVRDLQPLAEAAHAKKALVAVSADLLSLVMLKSPGEQGADVVIGSSQRFGVPLGFGGPHAAYMATRESFKRSLPGRLVGASVDAAGKPALRLALQTREQHIRREKATSNICTAQVLLAVIASFYAAYHGPDGLKRIANRVHLLTSILAAGLKKAGLQVCNSSWFDTLTVKTGADTEAVHARAQAAGVNLRRIDADTTGVSLDETVGEDELLQLLTIFSGAPAPVMAELEADVSYDMPASVLRGDQILKHEVFNRYHSETEMLRYLRKLADRDIALDRAMIPLGSCTMKLNATAEMIPVTWPEFGGIHPFAPLDQAEGYLEMIGQLEQMLCAVTGYDAVSLQPNAGSQGEYAGLLAIRAYHESRGEGHRDVCLIPSSAHGTNPASAQMCGMRVVVVQCDSKGNIDLSDLRQKVEDHSENLAAIMVTYPSTHGVFEGTIEEVASIVHAHGGQVYIDGANLNAMVGLCQPGKFGGDVSHLNLHKTFCIPHGGGGPGVGPTAVRAHLAPFLPGHSVTQEGRSGAAVSAAPWGSASILPITWMYIRMMGARGLTEATRVAILNANYIARRIGDAFPVLYSGENGLVAHECIIDLRPLKEACGITVDDVAKRLIDYGFHAPTMSFPVAGTLMIEPTESESLRELDRFCDAMNLIRNEAARVQAGEWSLADNPLVNAPHTADVLVAGSWDHPYSRAEAVFPLQSSRENKYWPPVGRLDNIYGDKNLVCACPSISDYLD
ncbi:aminomethyl-transferring glycine dehydrogenase [Biformimicrobium ophioploci]|uniref:Glycine dehydrogenase (decarboxylating) n=1 Tax=Biformimicrobium ophioploci TaxID=3036711 RepID=A0ABQ6LZA1_9GAMM|nr:aminomethyl-transferring glycine dehydrogenase [Microbulbifer sp. NKW57]GMG87418.1 aminomethyl-transferring glycine dehydrogenase [Microbulbifer sp. NKW57]